MRMINWKIQKQSLIFFLIILTGPFIDLITGYSLLILERESSITPGILYRGFLLTPILFLLTLCIKTKVRLVGFYFIFAMVISISFHALSGYQFDFVDDIQRYLKITFPITGFAALWFFYKVYGKNTIDSFYWNFASSYGLIVAISIVLFFVAGGAVVTYRYSSFATKALFKGQNSTSVILITSLPLALYVVQKFIKRKTLYTLLVEGVWVLSAVLMSTRAAMIGTGAIISFFHIFLLLNRMRRRNSKELLYQIILIVIILILVFFVFQFWLQQDVSYFLQKYNQLVRGEFRLRVPGALETISQFSLLEHLFGIGDVAFPLVENDLIDIYGKFGLTTLVPLLFFFLFYYFNLISIFFHRRDLASFMLLLSFTFYIGHAAIAGHALISAPVNNLFMIVLFLAHLEIVNYKALHKQARKNEKIIAIAL